jgi:hypothetical protein
MTADLRGQAAALSFGGDPLHPFPREIAADEHHAQQHVHRIDQQAELKNNADDQQCDCAEQPSHAEVRP